MQHPIIIIGAGPAGLMAAQELAKKGYQVNIFEQNKTAGRKFLVAGHGGFNLTHSQSIEEFVSQYDADQIKNIVKNFDNKQTINWLTSIGINTYVGSSGKIFPSKNTKPIQVLQAWLNLLAELNIEIFYQHKLVDFNDQKVMIEHNGRVIERPYYKLILALGGGSWQKTGSDAKWITLLENKNIKINPLQSANSGLNTVKDFSELEGKVLKNIRVSFGSEFKLGEVVFTKYGIEGAPIYFLNRFIRQNNFSTVISLDLKPGMTSENILSFLRRSKKITAILKENIKLSPTAISLLRSLDKTTFTNIEKLSTIIKNFPIEVSGFRPIDEVISTAGGVCFSELKNDLSLNKFPNVHCIGEMLDWEAPTGGYLLQACFSTGAWVARDL